MIHVLSGKYGKCYKSTSALAYDMGLSFNGVKKMIQRLIDRELLLSDGNTFQVTQAFIDIAYFNKTGRVTKTAQSANQGTTEVKNVLKQPKLHKVQQTLLEEDDITTKTAQSSKKLHKVQRIAQSSDKNKELELNRIINTTNVVLDDDDSVGVLYYQVIKSLSLPVLNHTVIKAKIKALEKEDKHESVVKYLIFMRDSYAKTDWEYKPSVNNGLEVYSKRIQIVNSITRQQSKQKVAQPVRFGKRSAA
jgi:hypothetical protein